MALPVCPQLTIIKMLKTCQRHASQSRATRTLRFTPVFSHSVSLSRLCVPADLILLASIERGLAQCDRLQSKHPVTDKSIWAKHMPVHLGLCLIQSGRLSFTAPYKHEGSIITPRDMWSDNESLVKRTDNIFIYIDLLWDYKHQEHQACPLAVPINYAKSYRQKSCKLHL